jgi:hypothetical protein
MFEDLLLSHRKASAKGGALREGGRLNEGFTEKAFWPRMDTNEHESNKTKNKLLL